MKAAHATNASDPDPKNIFREKPMWLQQKNVKRSTMKSKHTQEEMRQKALFIRPCSRSDNFIPRTKELRYCPFMLCHNSPEFQKIVRAFSRTADNF